MKNNKIIKIVIILLSLPLIWFAFWYWYEKGENEIYVLPDNYQGGVIILSDNENGNIEKYNNENERIYEIPKNGILKTKFKPQNGKWIKVKYKYKSGLELRYLWPSDKVWADTININSIYKDSIYVYHSTSSGDFIIGKPKDLGKHYLELKKMWKPYTKTITLKEGDSYGKVPKKTYFNK